jgi:hypothetical protein
MERSIDPKIKNCHQQSVWRKCGLDYATSTFVRYCAAYPPDPMLLVSSTKHQQKQVFSTSVQGLSKHETPLLHKALSDGRN